MWHIRNNYKSTIYEHEQQWNRSEQQQQQKTRYYDISNKLRMLQLGPLIVDVNNHTRFPSCHTTILRFDRNTKYTFTHLLCIPSNMPESRIYINCNWILASLSLSFVYTGHVIYISSARFHRVASIDIISIWDYWSNNNDWRHNIYFRTFHFGGNEIFAKIWLFIFRYCCCWTVDCCNNLICVINISNNLECDCWMFRSLAHIRRRNVALLYQITAKWLLINLSPL